MNNISFQKSNLQELELLLACYLQGLGGVVDDYWEGHILSADIYAIRDSENLAGCFALHDKQRITMFYVRPEYLHMAQGIFKRVLIEHRVKTAFAATCDAPFLSLCLDCHKKVKLQAYFFNGEQTREVRPPEYGRECLSEIAPEEIAGINRKTNNFFGFMTRESYVNSGYKIYRLAENGVDLGFGLFAPGKLLPRYYSCGMVTVPEHRGKGVGRSLQFHIANIIRESGGVPVSGCGYGNTLSKKTIESSGRCSTVRLLNIHFKRRTP